MIRDGDNVYAYQVSACGPSEDRYLIPHQWEAEQIKWTKIGTVVDAVGSGRKQLYEGKEYDYVFDVDIQDGAPPLKLPYNASGIVLFKCMYSADPRPAKKIPIRLLTNSLLAMSCHCLTSIKLQISLSRTLLPSSSVGQAINMLILTLVRCRRALYFLLYSRRVPRGFKAYRTRGRRTSCCWPICRSIYRFESIYPSARHWILRCRRW